MEEQMNAALEEACSNGDLAAARQSLDHMRRDCMSSHSGRSEELADFQPGSAQAIRKSVLLSAEKGHLATFVFLVEQIGAAAMTKPVISRLCHSGDRLEFCEALMARGWDLNKVQDNTTPLYHALESEETTRWLLGHGADPNKQFFHGTNPDLLACAAVKSSPGVVRLLLEHGASVRGSQALHFAAMFSIQPLDDDMNENIVDPTRIEVMRHLLDAGADVNKMAPDPKGPEAWAYFQRRYQGQRVPWIGTPLHHAIKDGSVAAVEFLLDRGADITAPSWSGQTAIRAAEVAQRQEIIDVLARHRAHLKEENAA